MTTNYTHLRRLAKARAVVSLFAPMETEEGQAIASIFGAKETAEELCGITLAQRLRLIDVVEGHGVGPELADELTRIINANHGANELATAAAEIDLVQSLSDIERLTRMNEQATVDVLTKATPGSPDAFGAATAFMSRLREIGRIVNPRIALLQQGARDDAARIAAE